MVKRTVLPNGIRVITELMPGTYSSTVMVWVDAGSNVESSSQNGISHLIEHMLFKGTKYRNSVDIVQAIEISGGNINAFTDKEATCFYAKVLGTQTSVAVDTILDMVFNSLHNEKELELEKQVVIEEIKMYEDTPDELVYDMLIKSFWGEHPLGLPITGTEESVGSIQRADILDFVSKFYAPSNIVVSIAGNFDEEKILEQIEKTIEAKSVNASSRDISVPVDTPEKVFAKKDIEQSHVCLGTRGISIMNPDRYAMSAVDVCLGSGMSSRLFQEIREKRGLVYSINTYEALYRQSGLFGIYAGTSPQNVETVIKLVMEELENVRKNGLSDEELENAKKQLKGSMLIGLESTKYRASRNARSELYFDRIISTEEICSDIDKITHNQVKGLVDYVFDPDYFALSIVGPKDCKINELSLLR